MYEAYFGLVDAPFRLTPDPRYLYLSPKHAEALAHLRAGLIEPGGFVCITGDVGTGKTTLLRTFLDGLGPEIATAYVFNPTLSAEDLLRRITRDLGVPTAGDATVDVMDALNAHLLAQRKAGRLSIVVIDEAQAVAMDVLERLRLLSNLETTTEKLLRLVLVGQPQLGELLREPGLTQLNQRITLRWHLGPLSGAETAAYVRHRLGVASAGRKRDLFTAPALFLVHRLSRGVPRLVNMFAHRSLLAAYVRRRSRVRVGSVLRAHREIRAVPLRSASPVRRAGWAVAAVAVGVAVVTLGMPELELRRRVSPAREAPSPPAPAEMSRVDPTPVAVADVPALAPPPAVEPAVPAAALEGRLAALDPERSMRTAVDAVLAAWRLSPLRPEETAVATQLQPIAEPRGLQDLHVTANLSMLRLLDLPALLELRLPGAGDARWVAVTAMADGQVVLSVAGERVAVDRALLDRLWFGEAHVLWRDFEALGVTFGREAHGEPVARLQGMLAQVGAYRGPASGVFSAATEAAVLGFQRSRLLVPDGRVGRLTRIVLYAAVRGYERPTLAPPGEAS